MSFQQKNASHMKTKICIISLKSYPLFNKTCNAIFGGSEVQLSLLARELSKNKELDVNFIVADFFRESIEKYDRLNVIKSFKFKDPSLIKNIKFLISFVRVNADVYIQRALDPKSGIIAVLCKLMRMRFIYMVAHDSEVDGEYERNKGVWKTLLTNLVFKYADIIIVQNATQKDLLYKNKKRDSVLIRSGYPISDLKTIKEDYILWVGRSEEWKRPELFIKLAEHNRNVIFKMICPRAFNDSIDKYSLLNRGAKKIENLEFIEYIPFDEIDEYFQKAKIFVNTSIKEGFPNTFIQAAKYSTPIISLNVNPDNFLNEDKCGFFCNNDFSEMNERLNQLVSYEDLYKEMSKNAMEYARQNHDITKNVEELYGLICKLD